jgi:hypothetical protein
MDDFYYYLKNDKFYFEMPHDTIDCGSIVSFLYDSEFYVVLKHGSKENVYNSFKEMVQKYSNPNFEEIEKNIELMNSSGLFTAPIEKDDIMKNLSIVKDNLTIISFSVDDVKNNKIDLETINKFVNCTGYLQVWLKKHVDL